MFGGLTKIFDRDFAIAFLLPATILVVGSIWLLGVYDRLPPLLAIDFADRLKDTTVLLLLVIVIAVGLMVINRGLYRFLEGYRIPFWYQDLLAQFPQRIIYRWKCRALEKVEQVLREQEERGDTDSALEAKWQRLRTDLTRRFPADAKNLLPTSFGNAIRAFEEYPRIMYGIAGVESWLRLTGVIDKEYRNIIVSERTVVDLWVNLWFVGAVFAAEYVALLFTVGKVQHCWFPFAAAILSYFAFNRATDAAVQWGTAVKSAFDLYRRDLATKLGLTLSADQGSQRRLWLKWSQAILYRDPLCLEELDSFQAAVPQAAAGATEMAPFAKDRMTTADPPRLAPHSSTEDARPQNTANNAADEQCGEDEHEDDEEEDKRDGRDDDAGEADDADND